MATYLLSAVTRHKRRSILKSGVQSTTHRERPVPGWCVHSLVAVCASRGAPLLVSLGKTHAVVPSSIHRPEGAMIAPRSNRSFTPDRHSSPSVLASRETSSWVLWVRGCNTTGPIQVPMVVGCCSRYRYCYCWCFVPRVFPLASAG